MEPEKADDVEVDTLMNLPGLLREKSSEEATTRERLSWATWLSILFLGVSGAGPIALGFVLVSTALDEIGQDLGGNQNLLIWVVSAWSIASAVSFSLAGSLSDIFGRRTVVLAGNVFCVVGSIIGATATSLDAVLVAQTLQGASCGLVLIIYAAIPELLPRRHRGAGLAWTEVCLDVPWLAMGALLGQLIAQRATWRIIYWIDLAYGGFALIGTALCYYPPSRPREDFERSRWQQVRELDYVAYLLFTAGLTSFLLGLSWANSEGHPWTSVSVVAPIIIGFFTFASAFVYDWTFLDSGRAMLPLRLFRDSQLVLLLVTIFIAGAIFYPMAGLLTRATIIFFEQDAVQIGITQLPNGFGQLVFSVMVTPLLAWTRRPKWHLIVACGMQAIFFPLCAYAVPSHKAAWMAFQFFAMGAFPWITCVSVVMVTLRASSKDLGTAIGLLGTSRSMGGAIGNAIFGAILDGTSPGQLEDRIGNVAAAEGIDQSRVAELVANVEAFASGDTHALEEGFPNLDQASTNALRAAYLSAWAYSYRMVFYSIIALGVSALALTFFLEDCSELMTEEVNVHLEKDVLNSSRGKRQSTRTQEQQV